MIRLILAATMGASLLTGCTVPLYMPITTPCSTEQVGAYVGQVWSKRMGKIIKRKTVSVHLRTITPGMMVTQEFNEKRVNVQLDERNRIARIYCG